MVSTNSIVLLVAGLLLGASARLVVSAAVTLARDLRIPSFIVGFLLLGLLTSTPELFVMLAAARDGVPQLSVGNLLGGSILLLSFIIGISAAVLGRVVLSHGLRFPELVRSSLVVAAPIVVLADGTLTRLDGALLVAAYALHVLLIGEREWETNHRHRSGRSVLWRHAALVVAGVAGMLITANIVVKTAETLMVSLSIAPLVFGLFLLSLGTNMPEIALAAGAILAGKRDVAFGDFVGSSTVNTLILGILGILSPFSVAQRANLTVSLILLGSICLFFVWAVHSRRDVTRREGLGLLTLYGIFVLYQLRFAS